MATGVDEHHGAWYKLDVFMYSILKTQECYKQGPKYINKLIKA